MLINKTYYKSLIYTLSNWLFLMFRECSRLQLIKDQIITIMKRRLIVLSAVAFLAFMTSCDDQFSEVEQTTEEVMESPSSGDDDADEDESVTPEEFRKAGSGG